MAHLSFEECCWRTLNGQEVLSPLSLSLDRGRILGVVGPNGAGKTTFLRLIYRYIRPSGGRVLIDGRDLWAMPAKAAACRIAAVLQEQPTDFALNVAEVVVLGRAPHRGAMTGNGARDRAICQSALARLGLCGMEARRIGTLSGGERQRVMIARALAQEPEILVLDEPTNHLDIRHQLELFQLLRGLGVTIVVSLHDLNLALGFCDDILLLHQGQVRAYGPASDLRVEDVSRAFEVEARSDRLSLSGQAHMTFHLHSQRN